MKILALRGKNLASLAAEFEIDFQSEPLASAGLFAITGATGSGKSTLLDALCLALYERTPRLARATARGQAIPDVGEHTVAPGDVRTLLRRGAGEGYAEVDFVGSDDVAYRARWSVRRSRQKATGQLQASDVTLVRIMDGQRLGDHTKTDALRLIEERIGLSFEQFTRAVLLAQNDFATFLKAPDDERAELLQTLTGTGVLADISKQAYARMKAERDALELLHAQLQSQLPMEPQARTEKSAALQTQQSVADAMAQRRAVIEAQLRWYQQWTQAQTEQQQASEQSAAAAAACLQAAPRQAQLQLLEQVQSARPLRDGRDRLAREANEALTQETAARQALLEAQEQAQSLEAAQSTARAQATAAEAARALAQPELEQARSLDVRLESQQPRVHAAQQAQAEAQLQVTAAAAAKAAAAVQIDASQQALVAAETWLAGHATLQTLAQGWQLWETLLSQAQGHRADHQKATAKLEDLAQRAAAHAGTAANVQQVLEQAEQQAIARADQLVQCAQRCAETDAVQLACDKQMLEDQREHLQAAAVLWQRRCDLRAQRQTRQDQQHNENATLQASSAELHTCAQSQPLREAELQVAEQALERSQQATSANAETWRHALQGGQPCPVCGALEHPYADHAPLLGTLLQGLQDDVRVRRQTLREVQDATVRARTSQANATRTLAQLGQEQAAQEARHATLLTEWTALALHEAVKAVESVPLADRATWLQERQDTTRASLRALAEQEAALRESQQLRDAAQAALDAANLALLQARQSATRLQAEATAVAHATEATQRNLDACSQALAQTLSQLDPAFAEPDWRARWHADPAAWVTHSRSQAEAWLQQHDARSSQARKLETLQLELLAATAACDRATQHLRTQTTSCEAEFQQLNALRLQRQGLLQGRAVADVEQALQAALQHTRATLEAAQSAWQTALGTLQRQQETLRLAGLHAAQLRTGLATAQRALDDWLQSFNSGRNPAAQLLPSAQAEQAEQVLQAEALDALLAISPAWMAAERDALHALRSAESAARAVLETRNHSLQQHLAARTTFESAEDLQHALQELSETLASATTALAALALELALDDQRLQQSAALRTQIDQQTAASNVWSRLSDLIGSADGKKFRNFAQQLTLDILLGYGNHHLQHLTSRYRLERIQDSLGLLVVDQDMGDEMRSVHSLSGGESFLVSLAMALGLASLSSHRVRVESLFIDEGFGSLDADSLRLAMDALDRLQSLGRKVGVISHVHEMTERIGTRVQVQRLSGASSRIVVTGG